MAGGDRDDILAVPSAGVAAGGLLAPPIMRTAFTCVLFVAVSIALARPTVADAPPAPDRLPVTGPAVPGYEPLDKAVADFMGQIRATAATVAVSGGGRPAYSRGFGYRDARRQTPTAPDDLLRLASVSKTVAMALAKGLIREGKLSYDTKAFAFLGLAPAGDPRLADVTVRHLLEHKGGWDKAVAGDFMFQTTKVELGLGLKYAARPADVVRYMTTQPLQFAPGERYAYSNFGYCALGRVIEKAAGGPYADVLKSRLADPLKIADLKPGRSKAADRDPREVGYPIRDGAYSVEVLDVPGGLVASAPALIKFLDAYWVNGEPRRPGAKGQTWAFFGSLPGTTAMITQRPDGTNVVVLLNARRDASFEADNGTLMKDVLAAIGAK
ncbi:MAG: beta-lactamase [Phycisphaerales bacterium]|nr:beta-lactamase [Phycisphaerales bacterium]